MNLHQVLTGAVNPGDHCFSVGSVGDQRFTVSEGGSRVARARSAPLSQLGAAQNRGAEAKNAWSPPHWGPRVRAAGTGRTWLLRAKEVETCRSSRYWLGS